MHNDVEIFLDSVKLNNGNEDDPHNQREIA